MAEFLSVTIYLSEKCGDVIREIQASGNLQTSQKDKVTDTLNPVTIADIRVQKTIEENLRAIWPNLKIQGEEAAADLATVESAVNPSDVTVEVRNFIKSDFLADSQKSRQDFIAEHLLKHYSADEVSTLNFESFNVQDAVVWIDPLDGTSDFVKGTLDAVTVLIGLSLNGKSRAGVIHKPFSNASATNNEDTLTSSTTFATAEHGAF